MTNIEVEIKGDKLILTVDLKKRFKPSSSGKTITIASTQGNQKLPGQFEHISYGLNVYTKDGAGK